MRDAYQCVAFLALSNPHTSTAQQTYLGMGSTYIYFFENLFFNYNTTPKIFLLISHNNTTFQRNLTSSIKRVYFFPFENVNIYGLHLYTKKYLLFLDPSPMIFFDFYYPSQSDNLLYKYYLYMFFILCYSQKKKNNFLSFC